MGIQKDAEEILVYIYKKYIQHSEVPSIKEMLEETRWNYDRIKRAILYLKEKDLIDGISLADGSFITTKITANGIDVIENQNKFKKNFGHTVNLGIYKFSWGASEK